MYLDKNSEKRWLIKSENRILGPYSFDQIIDLLRKKQISIIDEVRDPETRWLYVRENNDFKNIVEEIRKEIDSRQESTKTSQNMNFNTAITNTNFEDLGQKTKTDIVIPDDEEQTAAKEVEVLSETPTVKSEPSPFRTEKAKLYGVITDTKVQEEISDYSNRLKVVVGALAVLIVVGYGSFIYLQKKNVKVQEEELVQQVRKVRALGLASKSVELFMKLPEQTRKGLLSEFLNFYPTLKKEGILTYDDIKAMRDSPTASSQDKLWVEIISFWEASSKQNFGEAQEYLARAINNKKSADAGLKIFLNEIDAWLTLKQGQRPELAYENFKQLYLNVDPDPKNGRYLYGMAMSYLALSTTYRQQVGKELLLLIERYTFSRQELKKELLVFQLFLAKELNDESVFKSSLKQFFNIPPQLNAEFIKPELLMPETFKWKEFETLKSSFVTKMTTDEQILFGLHDLIEYGKLNEASKYLETNISRVGNASVRGQMRLLVLTAQGRYKDATALTLAHKDELDLTNPLTSFLLGMSFAKYDQKMPSADYFEALNNKDYGFYKDWILLEAYMAQGKTAELRKFLTESFVSENSFRPVIEGRILVNQ